MTGQRSVRFTRRKLRKPDTGQPTVDYPCSKIQSTPVRLSMWYVGYQTRLLAALSRHLDGHSWPVSHPHRYWSRNY